MKVKETLKVLLLYMLMVAVNPACIDKQELLSVELRNDIKLALTTGKIGRSLEEFAKATSLASLLLEPAASRPADADSSLLCSFCYSVADNVLNQVRTGVSPDDIFKYITNLCEHVHLTNSLMCDGTIASFKPTLEWVMYNRNLTAEDTCGLVLNSQGCRTTSPDRRWQVFIPPKPSSPTPRPATTGNRTPIKVLHLADPHYDPLYKVGSNADCPAHYFCCREESGPVANSSAAAGYWGDYRYCDIPKWTLEKIYEDISTRHKDIAFIIWTGDLNPHSLYDYTREMSLANIREEIAILQKYFPSTPVFPAVGNHEASPVNAYAQPYIHNQFDMGWLYEELESLWSHWLPKDVVARVHTEASYATDVMPGLRILSVNTQFCYGYNPWVVFDNVDPGQVLEWIVDELWIAEDKGVKVWIIGHIPSGNGDCVAEWSHQFNRIVQRFSHVIGGIFYAHTHRDHFQVFFDEQDQPIHVGYVAQSQTTYPNYNPGYKLYYVDGGPNNATFEVMDHENWYFDLQKANQNSTPQFELLYTAREEYGLPDLSANSMFELIQNMSKPNSAQFDRFYKNYVKAAAPSLQEGCDDKCKKNILCMLLVSDTSDTSRCQSLLH